MQGNGTFKRIWARWKARLRAGFTLIEILVVIVIILVLAALTIGISGYVQTRTAVLRTRSELAAMGMALESYKADWGYYPFTSFANRADQGYSLATFYTGCCDTNGSPVACTGTNIPGAFYGVGQTTYWNITPDGMNSWMLWRALTGLGANCPTCTNSVKNYYSYRKEQVNTYASLSFLFNPALGCGAGATNTFSSMTVFVDPFGSPYRYYCTTNSAAQMNSGSYDLWSFGPDSLSSNITTQVDDITNFANK